MVHTNYIVNPRLAVFLSTLFWGTYWIPVRQIEILSGSPYFSSIGLLLCNLDLVYRISRNNISKPYVSDSKLYIIKDNGIIKIN